MKITVEFDSLEQFQSFFGLQGLAARYPSSGVTAEVQSSEAKMSVSSAPPTMSVLSTAPSATVAEQTAVLPVTAVVAEDPAKAARDACDAMMKRMPAGQGAAKARELMDKHKVARLRDIKDASVAQTLINEFNAVASAY